MFAIIGIKTALNIAYKQAVRSLAYMFGLMQSRLLICFAVMRKTNTAYHEASHVTYYIEP